MRLIIDIPDEEYENVKKAGGCYYDFGKAIVNGTPLPKGHGELIDKSKLKQSEIYMEAINGQVMVKLHDIQELIKNAPTIIKADRIRKRG